MIIREAVAADLPAILALLAEDRRGAVEDSDPADPQVLTAFTTITEDPRERLLVVEEDGRIVGTAQLSLLPGLSNGGRPRAQIEAVRIASDRRGAGLGAALIAFCIAEARRHGCWVVQLTSNATRTDARRFYERQGFSASHTGFKLVLD
ncbi:GNAT family N-acetyltransferase [Pontivivens ytuae]|uniref:GNAT family N-acetyltransferase n=1 Tax=Pontivivens ytuae TaxID=2789856 RepID=A0A7S9LR56_9RHOB|nr:GNAT family N-acetyltransferase [Pontivivens ytuae]QPH53697.1 GNAT family N-acetyltransferase [Pontivivens ytuae]